eukprot:scaffold874_cov196-Alexandrium_tamarense.AAC.4
MRLPPTCYLGEPPCKRLFFPQLLANAADVAVVVQQVDVKPAATAAATPSVVSSSPSSSTATPLSKAAYAASINESTTALSTTLGHALLVVDGLNSQARRLSNTVAASHSLSVLDGMTTQAKRLVVDLKSASSLYDTVLSQAKLITASDETLEVVTRKVAHASSVCDGLVAQSKRLVVALSNGGGSSEDKTEAQIIYMLSILDGLNSQMKRLDVKGTFGLLDELNAKAMTA